ncbi:MAG: hypothetical protein NTV32_10100 [Gammaproteobacteria bacterium]|nr:hypothetical protein [Gammaproteobacteria bacterium]
MSVSHPEKSPFVLEKFLWSIGAVIMAAAMVLALVNYWTVLTGLQKNLFIVLPLFVIYALALFLSFTQKYPFLRMCLYLLFGFLGPLAFYVLFGSDGLILPLATLFLMLIPAVFETQKTVQVFCIFYVIWIYFIAFPFFQNHYCILGAVEKIAFGFLFWLLPWVLPQAWHRIATAWGRPLGAFFLLVGVTAGLFVSHCPVYLDGLTLVIGFIVLIFAILTHNRLIMIELIFFYIVNVLNLSAKYFNDLSAWPVILMIIGAGFMVFGYAYLKIKIHLKYLQ